MVSLVDAAAEFAATNPVATLFGAVMLVFIFGGYLLLRRTITEFRRGLDGE
jgi:hypothetical protein